MKKIKIGFIGFGNRGSMYGQFAHENKDRCEMEVLVDFRLEQLQEIIDLYQFPHVFKEADDFFEQNLALDLICISSMDKYHFEHAKKSIERGYHILLEKPISCNIDEVLEIQRLAKEKGVKVVVCHVLRYTMFYKKIKEIIDNNEIGEVVNINATENVAFWHQAHSYVRGNWRSKAETGPQILTKSSHDMDIIAWLMNKKVTKLSSFGDLFFFNKKNKPKNSGVQCYQCPVQKECDYDCFKFYIENPGWLVPFAGPNLTKEKVTEFLKTSNFGHCVFDMDNDVVDHQVVNLQFEDKTTASLTVNAFSRWCYRDIKVFGTHGDIIGDFEKKVIYVNKFNKTQYEVDITKLTTDFEGHGGGDRIMFNELLDYLLTGKKTDSLTLLDDSVLSHLMALKAEESRLEDGQVKDINK